MNCFYSWSNFVKYWMYILILLHVHKCLKKLISNLIAPKMVLNKKTNINNQTLRDSISTKFRNNLLNLKCNLFNFFIKKKVSISYQQVEFKNYFYTNVQCPPSKNILLSFKKNVVWPYKVPKLPLYLNKQHKNL